MSYIRQVDLPKGTEKTVWITLPGFLLNSTNSSVKFYHGGMEKGQTAALPQGNDYVDAAPTQSMRIGVLASDPDTMNFLTLLQAQNYNVSLVRLNLADLPEEALMLENLDLLIFNDIATDQMTTGQTQAVTDWTRNGGTLVLAGGAGYPKTVKGLDALSPVTYQGTAPLSKLSTLAKYAGKELVLDTPFTLSTASVKEGETVLQEDGVPLLVHRSYGKGIVWYAAYDLALQPLSSWNGNHLVWEKMLQDKLQLHTSNPIGYPTYHVMNNYWNYQHLLDFFPSIAVPSFWLLLTLFFVYVVIAAPVLYFVLKKLDKREWAWGLIPGIAILSSVGIFLAGASDKTSVLAHTLSTIELDGEGKGTRSSATAVFAPNGGTYEMELPKSANLLSFQQSNYAGGGHSGRLTGSSDQFIYYEPEKIRLQWREVPYWSVRKAFVEQRESEELGSLVSNLTADASGIKGEVKNATSTDLTDVTLLLSSELYKIGDLKAGESKPLTSVQAVNPQYHPDLGQLMFPHPNAGGQDPYYRERQMLNSDVWGRLRTHGKEEPLLVGWSKDKSSLFKVNGQNPSTDQLNLWVQKARINIADQGAVHVPFGLLSPGMIRNTIQQMGYEQYGNVLHIGGAGELEFEYELPAVMGADYSTLKTRMSGGFALNQGMTVQLWNAQTQQWEALDLSQTVEKKQEVSAYLVEGRKLRMKMTSTQGGPFKYPEVALEGTVKS
ncbi:hypothetical protein J2T17_007020 [Paenibacillus mucilaginosus]